jgi:O-antigen/teichoic acid export membrane protein
MTLASNILTTLLARVALLGLALIMSVVMARTLGPEGRGLLALVLVLPGLAKTLGLLGFEQANAVYAGLEPGRRRALVWQSAAIAVVAGGAIAAASAGFLALGAPGFQALVQGPLWLYLLALSTVPCALIIDYWGAILRGMNRIVLLNVAGVGTTVAGLVLVMALVVWLRLDVTGAVWVEWLISVGSVVVMGALLRSVGVWGRPSFDRALWGRSARFALPAHGGTVAAYLNYRVDELIIAALLPPEQLGFYVLAVGVAERLWILPGAVATSVLPHLTSSQKRDPRLAATLARHVMLWTGAACLLAFALADVLVRILYSSAFAPAVAPLRWLLPGIFTLSIGKVLVAELLAREKPRYTVWASGIAAVVNIVGNLILVPRMGISGAAIASSMSYSLLSLVLIWYYVQESGVPWAALVVRWSDLSAYSVLWRRGLAGAPVGRGAR